MGHRREVLTATWDFKEKVQHAIWDFKDKVQHAIWDFIGYMGLPRQQVGVNTLGLSKHSNELPTTLVTFYQILFHTSYNGN